MTTKPIHARAAGPSLSVATPPIATKLPPLPTLLTDRPYPQNGPAERFRRNVRIFEILADLITVVLSVLSSYAFYYHLGLGKHIHYSIRLVVGVGLGFAVLFVLMLDREGAYDHGGSLLRVKDTERILRVTFESFLLAFAATFFTGKLFSHLILFFID